MLGACSDDGPGNDTEDRLGRAECDELQDEFDNQSAINDAAAPGSPAFDRSLARMDRLDGQMERGGCYGP